MPFLPGNQAAKGHSKPKPYRDALRAELAAADTTKDLRAIARAHIAAAAAGDLQAIKELADRLDGKPAQEATLAVEDIRYVIEVPASLSADEWQKKYSQPLLIDHDDDNLMQ